MDLYFFFKQEVQKIKTHSSSKNYLKKEFSMFPKEIRGSNFTNIEVQCLLYNPFIIEKLNFFVFLI